MQSGYRDRPDGMIGLGTLEGIGLGKPDMARTEKPDPMGLDEPDVPGLSEAELADFGVHFASDWDESCYRALLSRQHALRAQLDAVERALSVILARARWSAEAIMERDG